MIEPNFIYRCKCIRVTDGDTASFDIDLGFKFWHHDQQFRFYGINAPELKSKVPAVKLAAEKSRDFVKNAIEGQDVDVQFIKNPSTHAPKIEKYGRYLALVYCKMFGEQVCLNQKLVDLELAKPYMISGIPARSVL